MRSLEERLSATRLIDQARNMVLLGMLERIRHNSFPPRILCLRGANPDE